MSLRKKQEQVAELRRQLEAAEKDLSAAKRIRAADPGPGAMVFITAQFPGSDKVYEYMAINTSIIALPGGRVWYVTGRAGKQTWDEILSRIERAVYEVYRLRMTDF